MVESGQVVHEGQPLTTTHVLAVGKKWLGEKTWYFSAEGSTQRDAAWSTAVSVLLAQKLADPRKPMLAAVGARET
jgi:hypothetical protein